MDYSIYVQPFPPDGSTYEVARAGHPFWSRDGTRLTFSTGVGKRSTVSLLPGKSLLISHPTPAPQTPLVGSLTPMGVRNYDSMPGNTMIGAIPSDERDNNAISPEIVVVLNWFEDVKRRVK